MTNCFNIRSDPSLIFQLFKIMIKYVHVYFKKKRRMEERPLKKKNHFSKNNWGIYIF
jgi:hypothetical protein